MKKVTLLGLYNSMATTLFGPMDIFNQAGRLWQRIGRQPRSPYFDVAIASADGQPIRCANNVFVQPHCGIQSIQQTDLLVIASATCIDEILEKHPDLVPWIRGQYRQGAHVASICTGVFLLAETGLLDGKSATLHWGYTRMFRRRYPRVKLQSDKMILDQGRLYCSAGTNAGLDLSLYLVEKFCGRKAALESAKTMVLDLGRESQMPYSRFLISTAHGDADVIKAQIWLEQHLADPVDYDRLAEKFRMSRRSMERRFKRATGVTPLGYMQQLRVEKAKQLLEEGRLTFSEITYKVGYEDISFFRKVFVRLTGLRPREYQQRFAGFSAKPVW
ncbi:MAG: helix-turn-helix domain-containing protein [Desulfobacteraceae bacterium]|jgi:transcriptional regulator GlxA family with amidase domain